MVPSVSQAVEVEGGFERESSRGVLLLAGHDGSIEAARYIRDRPRGLYNDAYGGREQTHAFMIISDSSFDTLDIGSYAHHANLEVRKK